mmetsp:Transcript_3769/g.5087  ORF Transcript_3769/g.5087 Transcript_3769/m.5087 type:complete len:235 (-) Transcript_3769:275-979(-)|eukprot:CAMPEP_0185726692 /NCGR_PEP_ID=MMETSP1171-20130828/2584_1 /TAXON_ID=374046 /ORGANISM="Helicotheca tamensis, Strain CCMP826" /LENGTH=234 /DNA_ID=CAMNT_0028395087 /DNA_START=81 /DNA_END=785 /DNA_ORIENTATION=+
MLSLFLFTDADQKANDDLEKINALMEKDIPPEVTIVTEDDESRTSSDEETDDEAVMSEEEDAEESYHELYLPEDTMPSYTTIKFSNNMSPEECDSYYSHLAQNEDSTRGRDIYTRRRKLPCTLKRKIERSSSFSSQSTEATDTTSLSTDSSSSAPSRVTFNDSVTEYPIHHFDEFPLEIRSNIWTAGRDVSINKKRNKKEYKYDFCDWRSATEEDEMVLDTLTGELIHPVHLES